jgi:hypothetical protein
MLSPRPALILTCCGFRTCESPFSSNLFGLAFRKRRTVLMVRRREEDGCRMTDSAGPDDRGTATGESHTDSTSRSDESPAHEGPDLQKLAQDWITLWQSELSAMAADREIQETWQATLALWAGIASAMMTTVAGTVRTATSQRDERRTRRARTEYAAGAPPPAAAPDARDAEIERLARHIATLEVRLGELERRRRPRRPAKRKR